MSWVGLVGCRFSGGLCFVFYVFLNKAFITAWPAQAYPALANVVWVGWLLEPGLSLVWMYHWPPTCLLFSLCFFVFSVLSWLVTYSTFSRIGRIYQWLWDSTRRRGWRVGGQVRKGGDTQVAWPLWNLQIKLVSIDIFFHGEKKQNQKTSRFNSVALPETFSDIKGRVGGGNIQTPSSHSFSCLGSQSLMD